MFSIAELPNYRAYHSVTSTAVTAGDDAEISTYRFQVTYNVGHPPPTATVEITTTVVPVFELEKEVPTPWARKGALYQPMPKVKDVWRAKWRLVQQRPRDGFRFQ